MENLLMEFGKQMPSLVVLIYFVYYFKLQIQKKDEEIAKLNDLNRQDSRETIKAVMKLTQVVEDLHSLVGSKISQN